MAFIAERGGIGIEVGDVAEAAAMSRSTLSRRFRAVLGRSPADEIRRVRLERARELLLGTHLSLTEVAGRCGFSDAAHFSHAFRAAHGKTPSRFRRDRR